ncbi:MAG: zf-HC2 domain-containing protein [Acidimicrobiia bacterium]|nr:zf-HC2 domain-containing protein [Acidimicrobiia bacterium]
MHLEDRLSAYLDSELDATQQRQAEEHLVECAECRTELSSVAEVRDQLRSLPVVEVRAGTFEDVAEVVPLRRARFRPMAAAAAVAALVVGVGFGVAGNQSVPLQLNQVVEQHVARASSDPGFNVLQVQAVANR